MYEHLFEEIKSHAAECFPKESCGVVANNVYVPCTNIHPEPQKSFLISPSELEGVSVSAVVHSHPVTDENGLFKSGFDPDCPSRSDMQQQIASNVPWLITVTDGTTTADPFMFGDKTELTDPLVGRRFRYGVRDCYTLVRAWYWQNKKVKLPEFPRSELFWVDGTPGYLEQYAEAGFRLISFKEIDVGDLLLFQIQAPVPNHAGVYLGKNKMVHHPAPGPALGIRASDSLSRVEPVTRWQNYLTHCLKRD